jgi:hypothetical protein
MKLRNLFYVMLALPLAFAACKETPDVEVKEPVFTLTSATELSFEAKGGNGEITYKLENPKQGVKVAATCDAEWVAIKGVDGKVTFEVADNDVEEARATKIVVSYEKTSFEVAVNQAAAEPVVEDPALILTSAEEMSFEAEGGAGEITYTLENPVEGIEVVASADVPWVANFAVAEDKISFNVAANEDEEQREAVITVEYGVLNFSVALVQAGAEPVVKSMTIADAIAAEDAAAITLEGVTVAGVYARGILVSDATGKLLVYANAAVEAVIGDVVTVEGTMATYAGLRQVATPTITKTGTTTYEHPAIEVLDGAAMDAYLAAPVVKYVEYTGTLSISGSYYNVNVEGATTAIGSIAYPLADAVTAKDGQKIIVRGYAIGVSSSKYVNTMLVECEPVGDAPEVEVVKATVKEFLLAEEGTTTIYELTGKIANVANAYYGNFDLVDETGSVYVYGLYDENGEKVFETLGLQEGDTITLKGKRTSYKETPQVGNAVYVSHVPGAGDEPVEPEVYDVELAYVERYYDVDEVELPANEFLLGMIDVEEAIEFAVLFKGAEGDTALKAGSYSTAANTIDLSYCELYNWNLTEAEAVVKSVEATVAETEGVYTLTFKVLDEAGNTYNFSYEGEIVNMVVGDEPEPTPDPVLYVLSARSMEFRAAAAEGVIELEVENPVAGLEVTAKAEKSWITINSVSSTEVKFSVKENTAATSRQATITVSYGEQSVDIWVNQVAEVAWKLENNVGVPAISATSSEGGSVWTLRIWEHNFVNGSMYTDIKFKLPEANTLFITDGTYTGANGGILLGEGKSTFRANQDGIQIASCEMTVSVDVDNKSAKVEGMFLANGVYYTLSYEGHIEGFLYKDMSAEPLTEWREFKISAQYEDVKRLYGMSRNGVEVDFVLHQVGAVKADPLRAGTHPVGEWEKYPATRDYCENCSGGVNGHTLDMGSVIVEEVDGGYKITFDVIDNQGTNWKGEYVGAL